MPYQYVSPGLYRDTATGKIIRSTTPPKEGTPFPSDAKPKIPPGAIDLSGDEIKPKSASGGGELNAKDFKRASPGVYINNKTGKRVTPPRGDLNAYIKSYNAKLAKPPAPAPTPAPTPAPPPFQPPTEIATPPPAATPLDREYQERTARALFPNYTPADNYDYQEPTAESLANSPVYQFAKEEGQRALDRQISAAGLTGSGAAVEATRRLSGGLTSSEIQRQQAINQEIARQRQQGGQFNANNILGNAQANAGRLRDAQIYEADRQERLGNTNFNRIYSLLGLGLAQNPLGTAYGAAGNISGLYSGLGENIAGITSSLYPRGGGGGGGAPFIPPPRPIPQDQTAATIAGNAANAANSIGANNSFNSLFGNYLTGLGQNNAAGGGGGGFSLSGIGNALGGLSGGGGGGSAGSPQLTFGGGSNVPFGTTPINTSSGFSLFG